NHVEAFMFQLHNACKWYHPDIICERIHDYVHEENASSSSGGSNTSSSDSESSSKPLSGKVENQELNSSSSDDGESHDNSSDSQSASRTPSPNLSGYPGNVWGGSHKRPTIEPLHSDASVNPSNDHEDKKLKRASPGS